MPTIDREALRQKYALERMKRLRPDGADQYLEPTGRFAHLVDDPWVEPLEREPVTDDVTVALIGGGFAGLCTGAQLHRAGITDVRIIDGAGDVGGVWYWNRYPGAMCDTAAMVYLPLLEETGHMPTMKYVYGDEIFEHAQRIAKTFDLYGNALFSTEVTHLAWDAEHSRWVIETNRGDRFTARFVAMGTGPMTKPKLPGLAGIETFAGHTFHTARWDYAYTGGDRTGAPMEHLADKRVGIIGTGATAVQCIPPLARDAGELFVFQRTPSSIDVRNNHRLDPDDYAQLEPGWQQKWLMNFATLQQAGFAEEDLVKDGWTDIAQRIRDRVIAEMGKADGAEIGPELFEQAYYDCDDEKMEEIRARVDEIVGDTEVAEALKPWYRQLCKRPCFHDEYLQSFNLPTNHLVDTDGRGVERIDETGVWANGTHYELDCIIFASGFEVNLSHTADYETIGRGGVRLVGPLGRWHAKPSRRPRARVPQPLHRGAEPRAPASSPTSPTTSTSAASRSPRSSVARDRHRGRRGGGRPPTGEREWMELLDSGPGRLPRRPGLHSLATTTTKAKNRLPAQIRSCGRLPGRSGGILRVHRTLA